MDEKTSESSGWEESEQVGPYRLHEQVTPSAPGQAELYRATHETSGAPALVLKPATDEAGSVPLPDLRIHCVSSASPGYLAVEVERSPWTFAPDTHSTEELVCTFEDLQEGVKRMARLIPDSEEPRPRRRLGRVLAGAATLVLTLVLLPTTRDPVSEEQQARVLASTEEAWDSEEDAWNTDVTVDSVPVQAGEAPRPVRNQKRAPCTEGLEVEVSGVCWLPIEKRPCPPQTRAYQGQCLLPVATPRPPVTSLDGGDGSEPH